MISPFELALVFALLQNRARISNGPHIKTEAPTHYTAIDHLREYSRGVMTEVELRIIGTLDMQAFNAQRRLDLLLMVCRLFGDDPAHVESAATDLMQIYEQYRKRELRALDGDELPAGCAEYPTMQHGCSAVIKGTALFCRLADGHDGAHQIDAEDWGHNQCGERRGPFACTLSMGHKEQHSAPSLANPNLRITWRENLCVECAQPSNNAEQICNRCRADVQLRAAQIDEITCGGVLLLHDLGGTRRCRRSPGHDGDCT